MSAEIFIKDRFVKISWGTFDSLYYNFLETCEKNEIFLNYPSIEKLVTFMGLINANPCNGCFDVSDYLTSSKDVHVLLNILEDTINKLKKECPDFTINALWNVYKELMAYGDELKAQGK